jgi:hypothetical protein
MARAVVPAAECICGSTCRPALYCEERSCREHLLRRPKLPK